MPPGVHGKFVFLVPCRQAIYLVRSREFGWRGARGVVEDESWLQERRRSWSRALTGDKMLGGRGNDGEMLSIVRKLLLKPSIESWGWPFTVRAIGSRGERATTADGAFAIASLVNVERKASKFTQSPSPARRVQRTSRLYAQSCTFCN